MKITVSVSLGSQQIWQELVSPVFVRVPAIDGTAEVGATLTGIDGTVDAGEIIERSWWRGETAIAEATGQTYVPVEADIGAALTFRNLAEAVSGRTLGSSAAVTVVAGAIGETVAPTFRRAPAFGAAGYTVGDVVTFDLGAAGPEAVLTLEALTLGGEDRRGEANETGWDTAGEAPGTITLQARATNASGSVLSDPVTMALAAVPLAEPAFTRQPAFGAADYKVGDVVTFDLGAAGPEASLTLEALALDGADRRDEAGAGGWDTAGEAPGTITLQARATNLTGTVLSAPVTMALAKAPLALPAFTRHPSLGAEAFIVGDQVTLDLGSAGPEATLAVGALSLDGAERRGELSGLSWDTAGEAPGMISLQVAATNATGSVLSAPVTATLAAQPTLAITGLTQNATHGLVAQIGSEASLGATLSSVATIGSLAWGAAEGGKEFGTGTAPTDISAADGGTLYLTAKVGKTSCRATAPVRRAAPVATGAPAALTFNAGTGVKTAALAPHFSGAPLAYAISGPAGVSIDAKTGVVSIDTATAAVQAGTKITVTATNSGGSASTSFQLTVLAADAIPPDLFDLVVTGTGPFAGSFKVTEDARVYFAVTTSAEKPTPAQVKAGQDNAGRAAGHAWSDNAKAPSGTLTASLPDALGGNFYLYAVAEDAAGNLGATVASSGEFVVVSVKLPRILSYSEAPGSGYTTSLSLSLTGVEAGNQVIVILRASSAPTAPAGWTLLSDSIPVASTVGQYIYVWTGSGLPASPVVFTQASAGGLMAQAFVTEGSKVTLKAQGAQLSDFAVPFGFVGNAVAHSAKALVFDVWRHAASTGFAVASPTLPSRPAQPATYGSWFLKTPSGTSTATTVLTRGFLAAGTSEAPTATTTSSGYAQTVTFEVV